MSDAKRPVVASYVPVFCRPEMRHVHRQMAGLARWCPHVITGRRENAGEFPWPEDRLTVLPKYQWRFFRRLWSRHVTGLPWQAARPEIEAFLGAARKSGAALIHLYFGHMALHWLPLLRASQLPVVVSFHGADAGVGMDGETQRRMMTEAFGLSRLVLARSRALLEDLAAMGCPREKLVLNRTGIPLDQFVPVQRERPSDGNWILLQGGRLIAKKDHATTFAAVAEVRKQFPKLRLKIAGEGPEKPALMELAKDLGISDAIEWLGFLDQEAMIRALHEAHVFVHPSVTGPDGNREGIPNGLLEAMATALPVVATRHGGIPEAVEDSISGLLVGEREPANLARAITRLLEEPDLAVRIGNAGAESVQRDFSSASAIRALEEIYDCAINSDFRPDPASR
ncbi:MAG: glycosyltransferase [Verrucomicrobiales bacterium]